MKFVLSAAEVLVLFQVATRAAVSVVIRHEIQYLSP